MLLSMIDLINTELSSLYSSGGLRSMRLSMKVLIKPELSSFYSSGGLKSMLSSMQLLVEMISGAFRALEARDRCFFQ